MKMDFHQGTIVNLQTKIVELEVELRLAEHEYDFLSEIIVSERDKLKKMPHGIEAKALALKIGDHQNQLETVEVKCDRLEREQRFYKEELNKGYIEFNP